MKSNPSGSSSDLAAARDLSHRLAGSSGVAPRRPFAYVSFRAVSVPVEPAPTVASPAPQPPAAVGKPLPPLPLDIGEGGRRWAPLLEWARQACGSDAAFLMDPHGLLIASVGDLPIPDVEAVGARMMAALDYARPIAQTGELPPSITLSFDEIQITGFEARLPDGTALTVCLAGSHAVPRKLCVSLEIKFIEALARSG